MSDDAITNLGVGVIFAVVFALGFFAGDNLSKEIRFSQVADGKVWREYTSDGQPHWVWKGEK